MVIATQPTLTVLDDGAARADLSCRLETKYAFTKHDVSSLRRVLLRTCRPIRFAGPVSTVRSIYFDDARMSACRANLDGVGSRHKTRIRWYDQPEPPAQFHFESKWRRNLVTGKHRIELASTESPGALRYRALMASIRQALASHQASFHLGRNAEPVCLVEYRREHFAVNDGGARFTLDYDIRFYPQLGRIAYARRFAEPLPGVVLIECKTPVHFARAAHAAQRVLSPLRARQTRFSKYVIGCQRLGYVGTS